MQLPYRRLSVNVSLSLTSQRVTSQPLKLPNS